MKDLTIGIIYLEDTLIKMVKDFSTDLETLQSNEDPIEEAQYYKGFADAIYLLRRYYFENKTDEN